MIFFFLRPISGTQQMRSFKNAYIPSIFEDIWRANALKTGQNHPNFDKK